MIDFTGLTPLEATKEYAEATKELLRLLAGTGVIPRESFPSWIAGAMITALLEELQEGE